MDLKIPLPFKACLFDEEMKNPVDYLAGIPRSFLIKTAILFLSYKIHDSKYDTLLGFMDGFFCSANKPFAERILSNISIFEEKKDSRKLGVRDYGIHQRLADLELLKIVFNESKEEGEVTSSNIKNIEIKIFKAYVAINQIVLEQSNKVQPPKIVDKPVDIAKFFFLINLNSFDLNNYNLLKVIITQYYKGCLFMKFLNDKVETKELLNDFIYYYDVESIEKYVSFLSVVHLKLVQNNMITNVDFDDSKLLDFYKKHSISMLSKMSQIDYNNIRSFPLVTDIDKKRVTVVDSLLTAEMFYNGFYFRLKKINNELAKGKLDLLRLKTHEFSENLLFRTTLKSIFGNKYIQFSGDEIDNLMNGGVDYYVRNGNKVFLFESKDIFLSSKAKVSLDEDTVLEEIKAKLFYDSSKSKDKGILQIRNFIEKLVNKKIDFDQNYKVKSINIYPILVIHNRIFNIPGFNLILQELFQEACDKKLGFDKTKINPLVVIDIDTLIFNREFFESGKLSFEKVLKDYSREILIPAFIPTKNISRKKFEEKIISFSHYLERKTVNMERHQFPDFIAETAKDILPKD